MRYKQERLKKALIIKEQKFLYTKDFADKKKSLILSELNKKDCSINFLSQNLLISPKTLRRYMHKLINEGRVNRKKVGNEYIYFLITH